MSDLHDEANEALRTLVGSGAEFRADQFEAIEALVADRRRALVVQRTGWGKSAVYFVATRMLRDRGAGPTLLVSPLLSLMRNQIEAGETRRRAARRGSRATTPTSGTRSSPISTPIASTSCSSRPNASPTRSSATPCSPISPSASGSS